MGKGDKKTTKGKRVMGSYGNTRKKKSSTPVIVTKKKEKAVTAESADAALKKAPAHMCPSTNSATD